MPLPTSGCLIWPSCDNILACRPIARHWSWNKWLYNSSCQVRAPQTSMFPWQQFNCNRGTVFSTWSVLQCYKQGQMECSDTSTVTLWLVGYDKKGSLKCETVKYAHESQVTQTRKRVCWRGPTGYTKDRPILSSERAPHKNKTVTVREYRHQDLLFDWPSVAMWLWLCCSEWVSQLVRS
jgi:hypothetical protein